MSAPVNLQAADYALTLYPEIGGSIGRFTWRGIDLLRPMGDTAIAEKDAQIPRSRLTTPCHPEILTPCHPRPAP